ncbi:hypothetical protein D6D10_08703 [Aureobasidium pullulans]|uniref:MFS general substrate transporter n=1 Tax=Aureobasidium pullulans TaxID=5580 RepID=A0A4S9ECW3_AURPU|nr:hypothetical protein D6D10_08703 [Aureobasidium pullulans]
MDTLVPEESQYHGGLYQRLHRFYRGTTFQAIILGLVSFTQPGIWDALNSLGAGGQAKPYVVNAANAVTFAIMVLFSPFTAIVGNKYSLKWVLVFGTLGYVPYCAALYCNSVYGTQWFMIFGAATCGFSASALWTAEGAIAVGYPEANRRGTCVAIWMSLNKIGRLIASSIQLGISVNQKDSNKAGAIDPQVYLVLIGLTCAGLPLSLLISPPEKVIRRDGTKPVFTSRQTTLKQGCRDFWAVCKTKHIYMLIPIFITAQWGQTYNGNYLAAYFSVRGRTLAGFVVTIVAIIVNLLMGFAMDSEFVRRPNRARYLWGIIATVYIISWIYQFINEVDFSRHEPELDFVDGGYGRGVGAYMYDAEIDKLALTSALLRSGESFGSTMSYAVGSTSSASLMTNLIVAFVVWIAAVPTTTWSALQVKDVTRAWSEQTGSDSDRADGLTKDGGRIVVAPDSIQA